MYAIEFRIFLFSKKKKRQNAESFDTLDSDMENTHRDREQEGDDKRKKGRRPRGFFFRRTFFFRSHAFFVLAERRWRKKKGGGNPPCGFGFLARPFFVAKAALCVPLG